MSEIPFHRTPAGRVFYEATMPKLVEEIARLNATLSELVKAIEKNAPDATRSEEEPS